MCFVAGVTVCMDGGGSKPIERVRSGDYVLMHGGQPRPVVGAFVDFHKGRLLGLVLDSVDQTIWCTPEHPWMGLVNFTQAINPLMDWQWCFTFDLREGSRIARWRDGYEWLTVLDVKREHHDGPTYDLTIEPDHSYMVEGGLVCHNGDDRGVPGGPKRANG